jgi:glycosyltransferase involved in cell wall biosynthesis
MNVVIVNDFAHVNGGVAQVALSSAAALAQRGHCVFLLTAVNGQQAPCGAGRLKVVSTDQQEIAVDENRLRAATKGLWNLKAQRAMRSVLDGCDRNETIIHLHGWTKALSSSVIREGVRRGYPMVATLHEYFSACPNGGFFNYQTMKPCTLAPMSMACVSTHCDSRGYAQKLWRVARQCVQQSAGGFPGHARHFISVSRFSEGILKPHLAPDAMVHPVRNPIEVPRGNPAAVEQNSGFTFVGRLSPEKGGVLLAQAAAALGVAVTFIGDGPMQASIALANPAAQMLGWLDRDRVLAQLRLARALVLPSLWYETQGLVVSEAAALGVPAIVPDDCAARESVVDGVTGLWFESGNREDLQHKMALLHTQPALAARMGAAAFARYWGDPPTLERHVDELEIVYRSVVAESVQS